MKNQKKNTLLSIGIIMLFSMLYASLVFKEWGNVDDIFSLIPRFIILGALLGILSSTISFKKPVGSAFFLGFFTPITTFFFFYSLKFFISHAVAGNFVASKDDFAIWNLLFIFSISILFGMLSILGSALGLSVRKIISQRLNIYHSKIILNTKSTVTREKNNTDRLALYATIVTSIISATAVILSALIRE